MEVEEEGDADKEEAKAREARKKVSIVYIHCCTSKECVVRLALSYF